MKVLNANTSSTRWHRNSGNYLEIERTRLKPSVTAPLRGISTMLLIQRPAKWKRVIALMTFCVVTIIDAAGMSDGSTSIVSPSNGMYEPGTGFPRRSCVCDIGVINHTTIMPIHEKSRPLKNCAVAVEYCKRICAPAVARQILGFRDFGGLQEINLNVKPFWEAQRSLGDALCHHLGRETSKPLELAVFSQAKTCGRRYEAANGTFAEKLCCHASETGLKSLRCPNEASTEASTSAVRRSNRKKNSASPQHTTTKIIRSTRRNKMTSAVNSVATEGGRKKQVPPEPGAMRERIAAQFQRFIKMLHGRWE